MQIPEKINGMEVIRHAWIAPDSSEMPYLAVIIAHEIKKYADPAESYVVTDIGSTGNGEWSNAYPRYDLTLQRAEERFEERVKERDHFSKLVMKRDLSWEAVALFKWSYVPVEGRAEFEHDARYVAGKARDFPEFYKPENDDIKRAIEAWLSRHSEANRHPDTRS